MNGMVNPNMMNPSMRGMMSMNNGMQVCYHAILLQMTNVKQGMGGMPGMQGNMQGMQGYSNGMGQFNGMGYHGGQMQMQGGMGMQGMGPQHMQGMSRMQMMQGMGPGRPQMMGPGMGPQNMNNMPIRAGGPSINMRMPMDPHGRMFSGQGRPSPYPNPAMYMAQKRHQSPMGYSQAQMAMNPSSGGQYMARGPFPGGPQGGYPMAHPHTMGGGPGPGFSGLPPGMHGRGGMGGPGGPMGGMPGQFPPSSSSSGPVGPQQPGMRPGGPGGSGGHPSGGAPGPGYPSPGSFPSPVRGVKAEVASVSPRGTAISSFQHSPVPGNPTPPLTPNGPGNCISAPFASPSSDHGSTSNPTSTNQDTKPNFSLASKFSSGCGCQV